MLARHDSVIAGYRHVDNMARGLASNAELLASSSWCKGQVSCQAVDVQVEVL